MSAQADVAISGHVAAGFEPVREAFARNFAEPGDHGAAFAAWIGDEVVVDLRGGWTDRKKTRAWQADTLVPVYSTTKPVAAIVVAMLVERAGLKAGFDTPVAEIWPDFAQAGKADYTIAEVLSHQAGLPGFAEPIDPDLWLDPPALTAALAKLAPMWPRGQGSGYHPLTWGYLAGEIARRLDAQGRTLGRVLREEITHRADGETIDFHIGLPDVEHDRVAEMIRPNAVPDMGGLNAFRRAAFLTRWSAPNRGGALWRRVEIPSANGHGTARATARLYGLFADGLSIGAIPVLREAATRREFLKSRVSGPDRVLPFTVDLAAGIFRNIEGVYGPNPNAFGHSGWGGSMGLGDPDHHLSAAYVMNRQSNRLQGDPRAQALVAALYGCL